MTYGQYWHGDVWMVEAYREAERCRKERKNRELHLLGMYIYEAFCDASPLFNPFAKKGTKPHPYRSEPYTLFGNEKPELSENEKEKREEADRLKAMVYMNNMVRAGKNWGNLQK